MCSHSGIMGPLVITWDTCLFALTYCASVGMAYSSKRWINLRAKLAKKFFAQIFICILKQQLLGLGERSR